MNLWTTKGNLSTYFQVATVCVFIVLAVIACRAQQYSHTIYVDPVQGNNSTACLNGSLPATPCKNLSYAFQYRNSSTQYLLRPGTHYLDSTASDSPFRDLTNVAIIGYDENVSVACFTRNAGLAFVSVSNIRLENVSFSHCSSLQNSTSVVDTNLTLAKVRVAVYFSHCQSITMQSVQVEYSNNATGVVIYNTVGVNNFTECTFSNNNNTSPKLVGGGGGGVYVEFSYCLPGNDTCVNGTQQQSYTDHNKDSTYEFNSCNFSRNLATNREPGGVNTFILPYRENHEAFGRGGGLSFFFKANATANTVALNNCIFSENQALWGAGLFIEFEDTATGNNVSVLQSSFKSNSVLGSANTAGGGVRIGHYIFGEGVNASGNVIKIENCNFTHNSAVSGGALSFSPSGQQTTGQLVDFRLTNCTFYANSARLGLAVQFMRFALVGGPVQRVTVSDIIIGSSRLYSQLDNNSVAYEVGGGALYMSGVWVNFLGEADFIENEGSALMVTRAEASFQNCSGNFFTNRGLKGGAILLLGASALTVNESTKLFFINNTAIYDGGAIYKQYDDRDNMPQDPNCFMRHSNPLLSPDDWGSSFQFYNNRDRQGDISIYATSLEPCVWAGGKTIGYVSVKNVFCWKNWNYSKNQTTDGDCSKHISSYAGHINYTYHIEEFPGIEFQLPIDVRNDLGYKRNIAFHAFSIDNQTALVDKAFEYVADNTVKFTGKVGESFRLELDSTGQRVWHLEMNVTIKDCPPGFVPTGYSNSTTCNCAGNSTVAYSGYLICDRGNDEQYTASLTGGHWMGQLENETLVGTCPPQFCLINATQKYDTLPQSFTELDGHLCGAQSRTGILCGSCKPGYGPAINSRSKQFTCVPCENVNTAAHVTYYILLEYVPIFILFLALIVFNVRLTTGPANAFILYSQVISSTFDLSADGQIPLGLSVSHSNSLLLAYQFPYGMFNLRFFEQFAKPFCLSSSFNTLDILVLDYVVGFFPLAMILMITFYVNLKGCCRGRCDLARHFPSCCARIKHFLPRISNSVITTFASFLLLAYSKFSLTSSYLITQHSLIDASGNSLNSRVYYVGQYSSSDSEYIVRYFIPATIIFLLLGVLPPLLLLYYPLKWVEMCVTKVPPLRRHYPSTKIHIFLDAFQGAFKHRMRFFAGLYFIFRLVIDLSYTLSNSWVEHYVTQEIVCIIFIVLLALCRPYKPEYNVLNFIDIAMFSNLAIITALGLYLYTVPHINPHRNPPLAVFVVQYCLVLLPLACVILYHLWYSVLPRFILLVRRLRNGGDLDGEMLDTSGNNIAGSRLFGGTGRWSIASSVAHSRARHRQDGGKSFETSGSGIDWERATLRNTYRRSPMASPHDPSATEGDVNDGSSRSQTASSGSETLKSPLTPLSNYVSAHYGSTGTTSSSSGGDTCEREPLLHQEQLLEEQ